MTPEHRAGPAASNQNNRISIWYRAFSRQANEDENLQLIYKIVEKSENGERHKYAYLSNESRELNEYMGGVNGDYECGGGGVSEEEGRELNEYMEGVNGDYECDGGGVDEEEEALSSSDQEGEDQANLQVEGGKAATAEKVSNSKGYGLVQDFP